MLIGDGAQDYKNNGHTGSVNYVPSQIVETELLGETPSDNWYVCVNGDDVLPDMLIGRLSAQTPGEVTDIINKIILYDSAAQSESWEESVLLWQTMTNPSSGRPLISLHPLFYNYQVKKVYVETIRTTAS